MSRVDGRKPLGRLRIRWKDNIKMDLRLGSGHGLDCSGSVWEQRADVCKCVEEPSASIIRSIS